MISIDTPPGTPLIVVWEPEDVDAALLLIRPEYRELARALILEDGLGRLRIGRRVTLAATEPCAFVAAGFVVEIAEEPGDFSPESFRIATLPGVLTDLLERRPTPELQELPA